MREPQQTLTIEFGEAQEATELNQCLQGREIVNELDLGWIHMNTLLIHYVSKILYSIHVEGTLLQIGI
jgi:hypothetical protein